VKTLSKMRVRGILWEKPDLDDLPRTRASFRPSPIILTKHCSPSPLGQTQRPAQIPRVYTVRADHAATRSRLTERDRCGMPGQSKRWLHGSNKRARSARPDSVPPIAVIADRMMLIERGSVVSGRCVMVRGGPMGAIQLCVQV
jgi:hypothetical protein